jgi:hypothetical protein
LNSSPSIIRIIKVDEMGVTYSMNGEEACVWDIGAKARRRETTGETKR